MNPYSKVLTLIGVPDPHSLHQADALAHAVLQMGAELTLDVSGNPVDAVLSDLRTRNINENAVNILAARLNPLRDRIARGQS
ncbi:hypothetical protein C5Y93_05825 [Blastopirellula marina]|uniref:Uncharacterized protein n=1 Tax=Blastopirellula marina TaxID=124 RepID=A0A2S8GRI5_9BACT|nr:hypothetical protein C5Y93_05825 [Blastopirellula marina]